ncbi:hypothetical protein Vau01_066290 [Virgisporangium aurantiacum]|uniref:Uncharacterized protein n=1 Tax=Virgisporangium aurantiacum TaxID=175570 RepID=A0A8J4E2Q0_9ACTN|nr:hypothetical protein Vau01_066290 [Virgisporangium aurantiacum]
MHTSRLLSPMTLQSPLTKADGDGEALALPSFVVRGSAEMVDEAGPGVDPDACGSRDPHAKRASVSIDMQTA